MPIEIDREDYSPAGEGVTYEAVYAGRRYLCVVAIHHLKMKTGKDALAEFRVRLPDVERATEVALRTAQVQTDEGSRRPIERVIVALNEPSNGPRAHDCCRLQQPKTLLETVLRDPVEPAPERQRGRSQHRLIDWRYFRNNLSYP